MARKSIPKHIREQVYEKYNGHCAYCGIELEYKDMQVDHLVPIEGWSEQGDDSFDNLMPSCRMCNHYKRAHDLEYWRKMIEEIPKKLMRDSYIYRVGVRYDLVISNEHKVKFYFETVDEGLD